MAPPRPILIFAYGNPARGDDALGPRLIERLEQRRQAGELRGVDLLTDFQLQIEHTLDLQGRACAIFVDASATGPSPFAFTPVIAAAQTGFTTHAMSPEGLLHLFERVTGTAPPATWLLAIRGYRFALGAPPSATAACNLAAAQRYLDGLLARRWAQMDRPRSGLDACG